MAKEAYYFSHDYGARNDPKLQKVLMKLGQEGKGVYWDLIEILFEEGGKLLLSECESYAFALRVDLKVIQSLINDFELFKKDDIYFWSNSVLKRLEIRENKSIKASENARKRWDRANAMPSHSERNAIKERKGKKKKGNKNKERIINKIENENLKKAFKTWIDYLESYHELKIEEVQLMHHYKILVSFSDPIKVVEHSMGNCWKTLVSPKTEIKKQSMGSDTSKPYSPV